jgi:hopanoid biosynthesis associated RND transporter like protein HpnN
MDAVERIRVLMQETQREVPGINVGLTGGPVLEHDEMAQSQKDTTIATILSLVICALIFIYGYSETGRPVKATLCLLVGLAYTLGYATLVVGHLNLLTITFLPMLIGLAIDFGVHLVTRYEEELRHGHSETEALRTAMIYTGQGIFTGALTTAGAFLAVWFTDFKGIQEMGLISGGGLVICLVPMLTMLPVLLLRGRQNVLDHKLTDKPDTRGRIEQTWLSRPALVVGLTMVVCGLCVTQFHKIYFDYNLLNMQSRDLPAVNFERKLIAAATQSGTNGNGKSVLFAAVMADTAADAVAMEKKILQLPSVAEVESMSRFLAADQTQKLATIREIKMEVADIRFAAPDTNAVDVAELSRTLWALSGYLGQAADATVKDEPVLSKQLTAFKRTITQTRKIILSAKPAEAAARLAKFQEALFTDVCETFDTIREQDDAQALRPQDLPETLRARFVGVTGKYLLQVFPKQDIWQRANQQQFVGELRAALDPQHTEKPIITGEPVQLLEYTGLLKSSYELAAWYSLAAIVLLVLIHFRNLGSLLLALVPVIIGAIWLGGFMGLCGIPFNPANIMTLPLVIGIGVTNGIHILNRYAEEKTPSIFSKSTGKAVLVSGLTTIAGFGSLMVAEHQGIQSLGYVMAMGVTTCMVAGLIFLPALLNLRARGK